MRERLQIWRKYGLMMTVKASPIGQIHHVATTKGESTMDDKKYTKMADDALDNVTGGAAKTTGWVCAECGAVVTAAKAKDGKAYCIPCYRKLFGEIFT